MQKQFIPFGNLIRLHGFHIVYDSLFIFGNIQFLDIVKMFRIRKTDAGILQSRYV